MRTISLLFLTCLFAAGALAADRIVYVDFERIYRESTVVGAVQDDLRTEFKSREEALDASRQEILALQESLEKEELTISSAEKNERAREIARMERDFVRARQALVEDRSLRFQERRRVIDSEIERLITELAKEQNYTIVLNPYLRLPLSERSSLNHNIIIYADADADITDAVVELFDQKAKISR